MEARSHLVDWLRDAHMMEMEAREMLDKQAKRLKNYPEMQARVQQHVQETESQAQRLQECIERLDGGSSMMKDVSGKLMGAVGALMTSMASDEVVKNVIADFAFENFEIASYRSLIRAAETAGDMHTAQVCRDILREEEDMAAFVDEQIPVVTKTFLERDAAGMQADR